MPDAAAPAVSAAGMQRLLAIMAALRDPRSGCPWDRDQTLASLVPHTIEEAYEVADAIERGAVEELRDELGDLLFQVVFYARIAEEAGLFDFAGVVSAIADKLERRHPHVFAGAPVGDARAQHAAWEALKQRERQARSDDGDVPGQLDGVPRALPALTRAAKLQQRAARVGFDWDDTALVWAKIEEELDELREAAAAGDRGHIEHELGDLMFACVNLARHQGVDAEGALRRGNERFEARFRHLETALRRAGRRVEDASLAELDRLWQAAKADE